MTARRARMVDDLRWSPVPGKSIAFTDIGSCVKETSKLFASTSDMTLVITEDGHGFIEISNDLRTMLVCNDRINMDIGF